MLFITVHCSDKSQEQILKNTRFPTRFSICLGLMFSLVSAALTAAPFIDPESDSTHLGSPNNVLFWTPEQQVAGYRNWEKIFPMRKVRRGSKVRELPKASVELGQVTIHSQDRSLTVDEYFEQQSVAGLLVLKDGKIAYERYGLGNDQDSRWISFSVAKSVVSMLIGAAISDGYIQNVDEKSTRYLPRLQGSSYDKSTIRNILQMASGVAWNEDYADPESDINRASWATLDLYEYLGNKPRAAQAGELFNYNTAETNLAGTLLRSAIGNNLSTYLEEKIWQPFGMESQQGDLDAYWALTEFGGGEFGGCCISATLRDYGRIGLFALSGGKLADGKEMLAENWMQDSTQPSASYPGYGYFWWLGDPPAFRAIGIFGQGICIHPDENVVIALHSARPVASEEGDWLMQSDLCNALASALKD